MAKWLFRSTFSRMFAFVLLTILVTHVSTRTLYNAGQARSHAEHSILFGIDVLIQLAALGIAAWLGSRALARPMHDLAAAATALGENLNQVPIPETGPVEARQTAKVFNHMQTRILAQLEQRTHFLAAVSHDLRTPLTRLRLRIEQYPDAALRGKLSADIREMTDMVDATLDFLRSEANDESPQSLDIQALVAALVDNAAELGVQLESHGQALPIQARPNAMRRCLHNVIENAVRYGGSVQIVLSDSVERLVIDILDSGPGIPEADLNRAMDPFVRLETSRNKGAGGVGLGLSIAQEALRKDGGTLQLSNRMPHGLSARIELPRRPH